ncbi:HAD family hydrolase [Allofrancisella guangzhouensis]|uniref:HAD family hydrolase n=1 Tax=Allofrancisella guangzhouensis TaxID=594679 RepID=A0A0A8E689_9GAMM|nr:HAD family hydrolase [Allofrancisella guangzhouensis]AJC49518.1 HAD family hydrolase [Allofrancisella guangzhouensis]MBK2026566.1 HAD family hydrolase [Allofrancisella guangzhouensis]MBK2044310.1 HAD family hydrolase [Allofrancisella guangzhouensis]MBK2045553.1 HAD family hydrolase [Allofrancisella guangzhouensis]
MFKRSIYTFNKMLRYKRELKSIKKEHTLESIIQLEPEFLKQKGIKYLALDFDGVLASHGKPQIYPEVKTWLDSFASKFGEERIFILSNKPTNERLKYFRKIYPQIRFISGVAKKPYPEGLLKIQDLLKCDTKEIALVDDRLLTGCLACIIAGSYPILITKPYVDRQNYSKEERFFNFLRYWEQKLFL